MPITAPAGVLTHDGERAVIPRLTHAVPNIGLPSVDDRREFIDAATRIVTESTRPEHDPKNIWVNVINAPDGGWGIAGQAYTGDELINSIAGQAKANSVIDSPS